MMENLSSQKDVQTFLKGSIGESVTVEFKLSSKIAEKTRLYNFYHKVVLGVAMKYYRNCGYYNADKVFADFQLKAECGKGIMLNEATGEEEVYLLDKSKMTKARLHQFITDCIAFLEVDCGYKVPDSASFLAEIQTGIKGFQNVESIKKD